MLDGHRSSFEPGIGGVGSLAGGVEVGIGKLPGVEDWKLPYCYGSSDCLVYRPRIPCDSSDLQVEMEFGEVKIRVWILWE
ncbi:hypothetical protein GJ744_003354 [Endocarpon pusillum]|uniref:Uncharacterized protein n=1 Tax=Endocarpon pusillum TaxID=364733 RepID=A0A8H7A979_9EURO|nr:hypothetical protein GJ744_003354 [Endocarpon pusillum]